MTRRLRPAEFFRRHPAVAICVLIAIVVAAGVVDARRLLDARGRYVASSAWAVAVLAGAVGGLVLCVVPWVAQRLAARKFGKAGATAMIGAALVWLVAFGWTHPRIGNDRLLSADEVGMVVGADTALVVSFVVVMVARGRRVRPRLVEPVRPCSGPVEVWHVVDVAVPATFAPYDIARCECGWVGFAREGPSAQADAFADARAHNSNVAPDVRRPLG